MASRAPLIDISSLFASSYSLELDDLSATIELDYLGCAPARCVLMVFIRPSLLLRR